MRGDDEVIASGGKGQYLYTTSRWKPCQVDRVLEDGDEVKLGGVDPGRPPDARPHPRLHHLDLAGRRRRQDLRRRRHRQPQRQPRLSAGRQQGLSRDRRRLRQDLRGPQGAPLRRLPRRPRRLLRHDREVRARQERGRAEPVRRPRGLPRLRRAEGEGVPRHPVVPDHKGRGEGEDGSHPQDRGRDRGRRLPHQRPADLRRADLEGPVGRGPAAQHAGWSRGSSTTSTPRPAASGPTPTRAAGTPSETPASSSPPCPSGGGTGCSPSRSTSRGAARRDTRTGASPGTTRRSPRGGDAAAGVPGPARPHPRPGRRAGDGRHPRASSTSARTSGWRTRRPSSAAVDDAIDWVLDRGYRNVLIEVNNECNVQYDHAILKPDRVHELIDAGQGHDSGRDRRLLVGTSYGGGDDPGRERRPGLRLPAAARQRRRTSPARIAEMVRADAAGARLPADADPVQRGRPLRLRQARRTTSRRRSSEHASWGYFDPGESDYRDGYQSPPVDWGINTDRKRAFFARVREIAGP